MIPVEGHCPMGCGQTLFVATADAHVIVCGHVDCPDPGAAHSILDDDETEHLVKFERDDFTIKHPLRERLGEQLLTCPLMTSLADLSGPPVKPGTYRAHDTHTGDDPTHTWTYTALAEGAW